MYGFAPIELLLGAEALGTIPALCLLQRLSRFGFRGSGLRIEDSIFSLQHSGFGIRDSGFGFPFRGFGIRILGVGFRVSAPRGASLKTACM